MKPLKDSLVRPAHPERICWGCPKYCPAEELACGNGTIRTPHPIELFGEDWLAWETERAAAPASAEEHGEAHRNPSGVSC